MPAKKSAKSNAKSNAKSKRGGSRDGSGRKPSAAKALHAEVRAVEPDVLAEVDEALKAILPRCVANLVALANGGFDRVEEKWVAAPTPKGEDVATWRPELVLAEREVSVAEPDRQANQYLIDRVLGKPRQAVEVTGKNGEPVQVQVYLPDNGRDAAKGDG